MIVNKCFSYTIVATKLMSNKICYNVLFYCTFNYAIENQQNGLCSDIKLYIKLSNC